MHKTIVYSIGILFAMIVFSIALNNYIRSQFNVDNISIDLNGKEGSKVLCECKVDGRTIIQTKTLPAKFTLKGSNVEYKMALIDTEHGEPFKIKVMKNNKDVLNSTGKGLKGNLKTSRSGINLFFFNFTEHSSSVSSTNMSDDEVQSWIAAKL